MISITYLYYLLIVLSFGLLVYLILNLRPTKNELNNKVLLKNLLEGLDMDLPEELKALDSTSTDSQKFS